MKIKTVAEIAHFLSTHATSYSVETLAQTNVQIASSAACKHAPNAPPATLFLAAIQPREAVAVETLLRLLRDADVNGKCVVAVPVVNPEGLRVLTENLPYKDEIAKNGELTCPDGDVSMQGVNLGHNWDFEWSYPLITTSNFTNPCHKSYRGPSPFSTPETLGLSKFIKNLNPLLVVILHSRHTSPISHILMPYLFHKSTLKPSKQGSSNENPPRMLSDKDVVVYEKIVREMEDAGGVYRVGTGWDILGVTISGSDLDWIFGNTRAWGIVLQVGTLKGTYFPPEVEDLEEITGKALINLTPTLPAKTTPKIQNSSSISNNNKNNKTLLKTVNRAPIYLSILLAVFLGLVMGCAYFLGYDRIVERAVAWIRRIEGRWRRARRRKQYVRVGAGEGEDVGLREVGGGRRENEVEEGDEDDDGVGFSYQR